MGTRSASRHWSPGPHCGVQLCARTVDSSGTRVGNPEPDLSTRATAHESVTQRLFRLFGGEDGVFNEE